MLRPLAQALLLAAVAAAPSIASGLERAQPENRVRGQTEPAHVGVGAQPDASARMHWGKVDASTAKASGCPLAPRVTQALTAAERATGELAGKLRFTDVTARHMAEAGRFVPRHTLAEAIQQGTRMADPQGAAGAVKIVQEISVNNTSRMLEIIYREADQTILHFLYR